MSIYLYWGEDDFAMSKAVNTLKESTLDPNWASFNYDKISPEQPNSVIVALNQAMTPPFGEGKRLIWLADSTLSQQCSEEVLAELQRTLPAIPESSVLLLTCRTKPDGRLKSTKLLQNHAQIQEFALISPWKTDELVQRVRQVCQQEGVKLTQAAIEILAEAVGNDTRQLFNELEKLKIYADAQDAPLTQETVADLVTCNTSTSLDLARAIRQGNSLEALGRVADLIANNEPPLKILATLVGQFRTWLWVKTSIEAGDRDDKAIATAAEIGNPKRIYFLRQEVQSLSGKQLAAVLMELLELEIALKRGAEATSTLQTKAIQLCHICAPK